MNPTLIMISAADLPYEMIDLIFSFAPSLGLHVSRDLNDVPIAADYYATWKHILVSEHRQMTKFCYHEKVLYGGHWVNKSYRSLCKQYVSLIDETIDETTQNSSDNDSDYDLDDSIIDIPKKVTNPFDRSHVIHRLLTDESFHKQYPKHALYELYINGPVPPMDWYPYGLSPLKGIIPKKVLTGLIIKYLLDIYVHHKKYVYTPCDQELFELCKYVSFPKIYKLEPLIYCEKNIEHWTRRYIATRMPSYRRLVRKPRNQLTKNERILASFIKN